MSADHILTSQEGAVLTVTIANEARRNAIGTGALDRLAEIAEEIQGSDVRAVILTGAGDKAFTSGFDLSELGGFKPENFLKSHFSDVFETWARLPVPVIGALNGHCMGGGVHVAVICDMLIARPGVRFMIPAARFGFVYVPASIRRIAATFGAARATQLLYMNRELVAEDLLPTGVVYETSEDPLAQAIALAEDVSKLAPLAVGAMKEIVREAPDPDRIEELVRLCAFSDDVVEGLGAMREKRGATFSGK